MCNRANGYGLYFHGVDVEDEDVDVVLNPQPVEPIVIISFYSKRNSDDIFQFIDKTKDSFRSFPDIFFYDEKEGIKFVGFSELTLQHTNRFCNDLASFMKGMYIHFGADDFCVTIKKEDKLKCFLFKNMEGIFGQAPHDHKLMKEYFTDLSKYLENKVKEGTEWDPIDLKKDVFLFKSLFRHEGLVMRNIDSDVEFNQGCLEYVNRIVSAGLSNINEELPMPTDPIYLMMPFPNIIPNIPILLKKDMPSYKELWKGIITEGKGKDWCIPKGDVLGYYNRDDSLCEGPHIVLCPENIKKATKDSNDHVKAFKVLMAKVLIHEIAHALMDHFTPEHNDNWPSTLEAKAMEESLANRITLEWFEKVDKKKYSTVESFVKSQSVIYQFGIEQYKAHVDWRKWRLSDKNMPTLLDWFNKCFKDGKIVSGLESKDVLEAYDAVFA